MRTGTDGGQQAELDTAMRRPGPGRPGDGAGLEEWVRTAPLSEVLAAAAATRDAAWGTRTTFSPKVFVPLTELCRDRCEYCTFAKAPARVAAAYLEIEEVLAIARAGVEAGCHE